MRTARVRKLFWSIVIGVPLAAFAVWAIADNAKQFVSTLLNGVTLAALYFLVASGFTLIFGLMRNVNLAHGSLHLFGAYLGWIVGDATDNWFLAVAVGFASAAVVGLVLQVSIFRFMQGQELRQTLVTIGISIVLADLMLWWFGGEIYSFDPPRAIYKSMPMFVVQKYPTYRMVVLGIAIAIGCILWWVLNRTRVGMMISAGLDDRGMLAASGVNVQRVFAITFAIGAGMAGISGAIRATSLSISPRAHTPSLLASLLPGLGRRICRLSRSPIRALLPW